MDYCENSNRNGKRCDEYLLNAMIVDNSPNLSVIFDYRFRVIGCNGEVLRRFGFSNKKKFMEGFDKFISESVPSIQPTGRKSMPYDRRLAIAAEKGSHEFRTEMIIKGKPATFNVLLKRVAFGDTFAIAAYLTERKKIDEHVQLMLDSTPLAYVVLAEDSYTAMGCNMEAVRLFGYLNKEEFFEKHKTAMPETQPDGMNSRQFLRDKIDETRETGKIVFNCVLRHVSGEDLPAELTVIKLNQETSVTCCIYVRDLREQREAEGKQFLYANLLQAVTNVATVLIETGPDTYEDTVHDALGFIGRTVGVDRAYIWQNFEKDGKLLCRQIYEWSEGAEPQQGKEFTIAFDYDNVPLWKDAILNNRPINGPVKNLLEGERTILEEQGIKSVLMLPISLHGYSWGFIGFDDCQTERTFSKSKEYVLQTCGVLIVSSIERNRTTAKLLETSSELQAHDVLLRAVNDVASLLLESEKDNFKLTVWHSLMTLGKCVGSNYVAIWRNFTDDRGQVCSVCQGVWVLRRPFDACFDDIQINYERDLPEWLNKRDDINASLSAANNLVNRLELPEDSKSLLLLPLNIHGDFWGFISFFHHDEEYLFNPKEINILRSGGMLIASAIIRNEITENLVEAREKALLSAKSKSEFLSRMSHEIRTPMNAIIGMTELAKKSNDIVKTRRYLETVDASSRQLLDIINDVLDMSKIDADKLEINNTEFDFEDMLRHIFNVTQVKLDEKKIDLRLNLSCVFSKKVISDELRLSQVLINLLSNAVKFTPAYGLITLNIYESPLDRNHSKLFIEIEDNGIGIQPERLMSIFQSFEQADGGITRNYGGTGLGLAICKRIIDMMGGVIKVESELGRGSKFTVELGVEWGGDRQLGPSTVVLSKDLRILVVDDAPDSIEYLQNCLANFSLTCDTAKSGYEAINMVSERMRNCEPYDVIFLDWFMPGLGGGETAVEINKIMGGNVIVIMVSGGDRDEIENAAEAAGVHYFLPKPVLSSDLYNMLVKLMGIPSPALEDVPEAVACNWRGKRILVADDNEINREIVAGILEDTGATIEFAENGLEALEMYTSEQGNFDIILMDVQMPKLDGLSAARRIRSSGVPGAEKIPIVAMTANAFKEDEAASYSAGMNGHIAKPFDIAEIFKLLQSLLK